MTILRGLAEIKWFRLLTAGARASWRVSSRILMEKKMGIIRETVIVRDHKAGVHVGTLEEFNQRDKTAVLSKARKIWSWTTAASCHGLAIHGPGKGSKVCPVVDLVYLNEVVEIVLCSTEGGQKCMEFTEWIP